MRTAAAALALALWAPLAGAQERPRVRDFGVEIGALPPGPLNAITDVAGVLVGHATLIEGDSIRTGVTAVRPHPGDLFAEKVPAAIHVANGFGKLAGISQVDELGTIETPIVLTNTLAVGRAADAVVRWTLERTASTGVRSVNPVVGETNDAGLNAITVPRVGREEVVAAIDGAAGGPVVEGSVGAGTGTRALGFKGGIGTASRRVRIGGEVYTLGVLVQSNFGGALEIRGVPVGRALGAAGFLDAWSPAAAPVDAPPAAPSGADRDGSIMIVVATDAPVDAHGLGRIARRAPYAIGRVGGFSSHGSGDYVIAFSTAEGLRVPYGGGAAPVERAALQGSALDPLFLAVVEATEEAILNSLFRATAVAGRRETVEALPLDRVRELLWEGGAGRNR
ncbi:MAG TPA: P1 family peptidase [Gemmatimonadota bacterium]|nr:P1 family peptidase [Gemmatimonadota bacterium]